jgi:hypothetical protein
VRQELGTQWKSTLRGAVCGHFAVRFEAFLTRLGSLDPVQRAVFVPARVFAGGSLGPRACLCIERCAGEKTRRPVAVMDPLAKLVVEARKAVEIDLKGAVCCHFPAKIDAFLTRVGSSDMVQTSRIWAGASFWRGTPLGPRAHVASVASCAGEKTRRPVAVTNLLSKLVAASKVPSAVTLRPQSKPFLCLLTRQTWCNVPYSVRPIVLAGDPPGPRACCDRSCCAGEKTRRPVAVMDPLLKMASEDCQIWAQRCSLLLSLRPP